MESQTCRKQLHTAADSIDFVAGGQLHAELPVSGQWPPERLCGAFIQLQVRFL